MFFVLVATVLAERGPIARLAGWGPLAAIGVMSYSLYLVHQPVIQAVAHLLRQAGAGSGGAFLGLLGLLPAVLLLAWLLFQLVERRGLARPVPAATAAAAADQPSRLSRAVRLA